MQTLANIFRLFIWFENAILRTNSVWAPLCITHWTVEPFTIELHTYARFGKFQQTNRQSNKTFEMHTLNASLVCNQDEYVFKSSIFYRLNWFSATNHVPSANRVYKMCNATDLSRHSAGSNYFMWSVYW